jgi:hypothetical protein
MVYLDAFLPFAEGRPGAVFSAEEANPGKIRNGSDYLELTEPCHSAHSLTYEYAQIRLLIVRINGRKNQYFQVSFASGKSDFMVILLKKKFIFSNIFTQGKL